MKVTGTEIITEKSYYQIKGWPLSVSDTPYDYFRINETGNLIQLINEQEQFMFGVVSSKARDTVTYYKGYPLLIAELAEKHFQFYNICSHHTGAVKMIFHEMVPPYYMNYYIKDNIGIVAIEIDEFLSDEYYCLIDYHIELCD
jgi:hypothetical protein